MSIDQIDSNLTFLNGNLGNEMRFSHLEKKILEFRKEGKSVREIAAAVNLSSSQIRIKFDKIDTMLKSKSPKR